MYCMIDIVPVLCMRSYAAISSSRNPHKWRHLVRRFTEDYSYPTYAMGLSALFNYSMATGIPRQPLFKVPFTW